MSVTDGIVVAGRPSWWANRPRLGLLAGASCGLAISAALVVSGVLDEPEPVTQDEASAAFLAAWEDYRIGTFTLVGDFERTVASGESLRSPYRLTQAPPRRVLVQFGELEGRDDDRELVCRGRPGAGRSCGLGTAGDTYAEDLADELDVLRTYFADESTPLYWVTVRDACFELRLARRVPAAPYGERTRFCFDTATGALVEQVTERPEGTDRLDITTVLPRVDDDDFRVLVPLPVTMEGTTKTTKE